MPSATLAEPAYLSIPPYERTLGDEVADLCEAVGYAPDPEQRLLLDATFALGSHGRSAAFEIAAIACRQNLKTGFFKQAALGWLFLTDERLVVWSAHEFDTAIEAFRDLKDIIDGSDMLRRRVKRIYEGNGGQRVELLGGRRLNFKARTHTGGRGLSGNKVILDEGFALQASHMGALLPTLSAQPDPQVLYGSSAGLPTSAILRAVRDRGRKGGDPRLVYAEWCAPPAADICAAGKDCPHVPGTDGCACDQPRYWRMGNPAMGRRITEEYIAAERRALPPAEFGRERMGWWDDPLDEAARIDPEQWADRADPESQVADPVALAVAIDPNGAETLLGVGGRRADGFEHVEIIERRTGTAGVVDRMVELAGRWRPCVTVLNPAGPAGALIPELIERGFATDPVGDQHRLHLVAAREYAQACGALAAAVANDRIRHFEDPVLQNAVETARTRPLSDAWAWAQNPPLEVVTLARHGHAVFGTVPPSAPFAIWG